MNKKINKLIGGMLIISLFGIMGINNVSASAGITIPFDQRILDSNNEPETGNNGIINTKIEIIPVKKDASYPDLGSCVDYFENVSIKNGYISVEIGDANGAGSTCSQDGSILESLDPSKYTYSISQTVDREADGYTGSEETTSFNYSIPPAALNAASLGGKTAEEFNTQITDLQNTVQTFSGSITDRINSLQTQLENSSGGSDSAQIMEVINKLKVMDAQKYQYKKHAKNGDNTFIPANSNITKYALNDEITGLSINRTDSFMKMNVGDSSNYCRNMDYETTGGGYDDWYLPNIKELITLVEDRNFVNSSSGKGRICQNENSNGSCATWEIGDNTDSDGYANLLNIAKAETSDFLWSSTVNPNNTNQVFAIRIKNGTIGEVILADKNTEYTARCIRKDGSELFNASSQSQFQKSFELALLKEKFSTGEPGYEKTSSLVYDRATGLSWFKISRSGYNVNDAIAYCSGSEEGGFDDWYLPNIKQLLMGLNVDRTTYLTDAVADTPWDTTGLPDNVNYLSSTRDPNNTTKLYQLQMDLGGGDDREVSRISSTNNTSRLICVRNGKK